MRLHRPARRAALVLHVLASVSWLGVTLGLLALGTTAITSGSSEAIEASCRSMKTLVDWLIVPLALLTFLSGLLLSLGTSWGLARYRWVYTKFWLTLVTMSLSIFALRPTVSTAAADAIAGHPLAKQVDLIVPPSVSLTTYVFMTALSVLKPWGLTKRGRRLRSATRGGSTTRSSPAVRGGSTTWGGSATAAVPTPVPLPVSAPDDA